MKISKKLIEKQLELSDDNMQIYELQNVFFQRKLGMGEHKTKMEEMLALTTSKMKVEMEWHDFLTEYLKDNFKDEEDSTEKK